MLRISDIKIPVTEKLNKTVLKNAVEKALKTTGVGKVGIVRQSVDARDKSRVVYNLTLDFELIPQKRHREKQLLKLNKVSLPENAVYRLPKCASKNARPLVVGFGPAGMFCGLALAEMGLKPVIIERGKCVEERISDVERFKNGGGLDSASNIQFGEGGAGTFSDGKLTTGIKDERCMYVTERFVQFGAPPQIKYLAKPHIGTDNLVNVVKNLRLRIEELGGVVLFEHRLTDICIKNGLPYAVKAEHKGVEKTLGCNCVVLAIGHSARDTFGMLYEKGLAMEQKPFAVGVRIEHKQKMINEAQYGKFADFLPAADYKLTAHLPNGRTAYSFCMCPGGEVIAAASEEGGVVTNGMSRFARDGENANAALLVNVPVEDLEGEHPLMGVELQRSLERKAYEEGGGDYSAPAQRVGDLLNDRPSEKPGDVVPSYKPGVKMGDMRRIFPESIYTSIKEGILAMDKKLKGFADPDAVVTAVESRSSSPVRIKRDIVSLQSINAAGIYPCGEGCGYAGGIMSAAADGVRVAEKIALLTD